MFVNGHHVDAMRWILSGTRQLPDDYIAVLDEVATFMRGDDDDKKQLDTSESFQRSLHDAAYAEAFDRESLKVLKRYNAIISS